MSQYRSFRKERGSTGVPPFPVIIVVAVCAIASVAHVGFVATETSEWYTWSSFGTENLEPVVEVLNRVSSVKLHVGKVHRMVEKVLPIVTYIMEAVQLAQCNPLAGMRRLTASSVRVKSYFKREIASFVVHRCSNFRSINHHIHAQKLTNARIRRSDVEFQCIRIDAIQRLFHSRVVHQKAVVNETVP